MLKCQWHMDECDREAHWACDVPIIGETVCFCHEHMIECGDDGWYPLTPEQAAQEEKAERFWREKTLPAFKKAWAERNDKR